MKMIKLSLSVFALSYAMFVLPAANDELTPSKSEQKILDKIEEELNRYGPVTDADGSLWKKAVLDELRLNSESRLSKEELKKDPHAKTLVRVAEIINGGSALSRTFLPMGSLFRQTRNVGLSDRARNALILEIQTRRPITPRSSRPTDLSGSDSFIGNYSADEIGIFED